MSWKLVAILFVALFVVPRLLWLLARAIHKYTQAGVHQAAKH